MTHSSQRLKVYSASAGSGKTFTLTAEYLRYALKNPASNYRKILAITFTNKATQEMKERILEACEAFSHVKEVSLTGRNKELWKKVQEDTGYTDDDLAERAGVLFTQVLHNYSDFAVSTIDSFSQRIIRAFALELNVPVNFEVVLESEETLRVLRDRLIALVGREDGISDLLMQIMLSNLTDYDRFDIRKEIYDSAEILTRDESINYFDELDKITPEDIVKIINNLSAKRSDLIKKLEELAELSLLILNTIGIPLSEYSGRSPFHSAYTKILNGQYDTVVNATFKKTMEGTSTYFPKSKKHHEEEVEHIKEEISRMGFEIIDHIQSLANVDFIYKNLSKIALLSYLRKLYKSYQHEEDILLISEFNQLIYDKVKGQPAPFIYEKIGEQYDYFLIDEFQDTSVMQFHNLVPLLTERLSAAAYPESLIVGDSKQAIYRFRGGEISQLTKLPGLVGSDDDHILQEHESVIGQHLHRSNLPVNYRSREEIVAFNNRLFSFVKEHPDLVSFRTIYDDVTQEIFHTGSGGYVEIRSYESMHNRLPREQREELEQERIKDMLSIVTDALERGFSLSDIAVLTRGKKELQLAGEALTNAGYDVVSSESLLIANDFSIAVFPLLYQYLLDASNEVIQLEIVTKLKMIGVLHDDLHDINTELKSAESLEAYFVKKGVPFNISQLSRLTLMEGWEYFASRLPSEAIKPAMHGYFREYLYDFVNKYGNDFDHFVLWWQERKHKLSIETSEDITGVRMMTIHKSKGLEFPIVIMPFANWEVKKKEDEWIEVDHPDFKPLEVIYGNISSSLGGLDHYNEAYLRKVENVTLDNLNLLYVALTRAVAELYIFSEDVSASSRSKKTLNDMSKISDLLYIFSEQHPVQYGHKVIINSHEAKDKSKLTLHYETGRKAHIDIKARSKTIWNEEVLDKIAYGSIVHAILEQINGSKSVEDAIQQAVRYGWITEEEREQVSDMIQSIVDHPQVAKYFTQHSTVKAEASILTPEGTVFIPDRIHFDGEMAYVLDFKSGNPLKKHEKQISAYADLLTGMGYTVAEKLLVYTDPLEIKTV